MAKLVSVFIAFREARRLPQLERCIRSFLVQTRPPDEIVVVGRRKELSPLFDKFSLKGRKTLKLVFSDVGKNEARNLGIKNAHGKYLLYADHDMQAEKHLIEKCLKKAGKYDALIIPEKGKGGNFLENVKRLEKEIITYDLDTVTPRFFKKDIFKPNEEPFDRRFGQLDEWGFNVKIKEKGTLVGIAAGTYFTVTEDNLTFAKEIDKKFKRGLWLKNFYETDKNEAWRRVNPIKRGLIFYGKRIDIFFKDPIHFAGLLLVKSVDLTAFIAGYIVGSVRRPKPISYKQNTIELYNQLGKEYVSKMFLASRWNRYVDEVEKEAVRKFWNFKNKQSVKGERLLDLGVGPGRWSIFFLRFDFKSVVGIDIAAKMVKVAKKTIKDKRFQAKKADMESLPFFDKSYDKVFCFRSFKYVENSDRAIAEMERVLSPGGTILLEVSNNSLQNLAAKSISKLVVKVMFDLPVDSKWRYFANANFFSPADIGKILAKHNLKIVKDQPLFILPSVKMVSALILLDKILFLILPKRFFARSFLFLISR